MGTIENLSLKEFEALKTDKEKNEYCHWCFAKTFASCPDCYIEKERVQKRESKCCEHDSDCAVHNEPAYPSGECNCSVKEATK